MAVISESKDLPIMENCPETIPLSPHLAADLLAPMECWPMEANRQCYCFTPRGYLLVDSNEHKNFYQVRTNMFI